MKALPETMVEYWDEGKHQRDHEAFKKWQRQPENKEGFRTQLPTRRPCYLPQGGVSSLQGFLHIECKPHIAPKSMLCRQGRVAEVRWEPTRGLAPV
jgi:hypothetical protein